MISRSRALFRRGMLRRWPLEGRGRGMPRWFGVPSRRTATGSGKGKRFPASPRSFFVGPEQGPLRSPDMVAGGGPAVVSLEYRVPERYLMTPPAPPAAAPAPSKGVEVVEVFRGDRVEERKLPAKASP